MPLRGCPCWAVALAPGAATPNALIRQARAAPPAQGPALQPSADPGTPTQLGVPQPAASHLDHLPRRIRFHGSSGSQERTAGVMAASLHVAQAVLSTRKAPAVALGPSLRCSRLAFTHAVGGSAVQSGKAVARQQRAAFVARAAAGESSDDTEGQEQQAWGQDERDAFQVGAAARREAGAAAGEPVCSDLPRLSCCCCRSAWCRFGV